MILSKARLLEIASQPNTPPSRDTYSRVAKIHKYWSRKPWSVVDHLIMTYTNPKYVVLDPFCGSGIIGLQTLKAGRKFIGSDLNPFAVRLTQETLNTDFNLEEFQSSLTGLRNEVKDLIDNLYQVGSDLVLYSIPNYLQTCDYNAVVITPSSIRSKKKKLDLSALPKISFRAADDPFLPDQEFPKKFYKDRFSYKGVSKVSDLFSHRNLLALSLLHKAIQRCKAQDRAYFELCLTNTLLHVSKLKSERVRPLGVNNYWIPDDFIEENVWWRFDDRCKQFAIAKDTISRAFSHRSAREKTTSRIQIGDATDLSWLEDNSVDYILTDPPYGDAIQYSELSLIWNCWLNQTYESSSEIIINPVQGKNSDTYISMIRNFLEEAARVLKINFLMTLSFHSKDIGLWCKLASELYKTGFELEDLYISNGVGSPFTKNWAKFSPKSDVYITVRNKRSINRTAIELSGEEFLQVISAEIDVQALNQHQLYDFLVLAAINESMQGKNLSDLDRKNMSALLSRIAIHNE